MKKILLTLTYFALILLIGSSSFAAQVNFTPRISISEEYTDNLFLSDTDKEYDYITSVSPAFTLGVIGQHAGIDLSFDPSYAWYSRFEERNRWRYGGNFLGWGQLSRNTRLEIADTYIYTEDPIDEQDFTIRDTREPYYRNTAEGRFIHQFGEEDSFRLNYRYRTLENEDPTIEDTRVT